MDVTGIHMRLDTERPERRRDNKDVFGRGLESAPVRSSKICGLLLTENIRTWTDCGVKIYRRTTVDSLFLVA